jgi:large subunit ribosomal protein L25
MELAVQKREKFGKAVKALRQSGWVPAELYGRGVENLHLSVPAKELNKVLKSAGESGVFNIVLDNKPRSVLLYDIQRDPVSDQILNVDFYQVRLDEKIKVRVPIEFTGVAPAVKDAGGILIKAVQEAEVEALAADLPRSLVADLSSLKEIGQSIYVKNLPALNGVKIMLSPETVIATVTAKAVEEEAAAPAIDVSQVKVETEEKKAEREKEKAAAEPPKQEVVK